MSHRTFIATVVLIALAGIACQKPVEPLPLGLHEKDYSRQLAPGEFALRRVTNPADYPDFGKGWYRAKGVGLREAVQHSIEYLEAPSSHNYYPMGPITHEKAAASLELFLSVLDEASSPDALNTLIREKFDVYMSVGCDDDGTVLYTGYYSPIFEGSMTQTERFRFPLYKLPDEIKKDAEGNVVGGPWRSREEIETGHLLEGQELAWLGDRFESYVITVQGSGFLKLSDGTLHEVGYAGNNGHEYTSVGNMMVADGKIDRNRRSLATMIRYFKQYPQDLDAYLYQNKRYIFFRDSQGGPYGCLGKPVTAECSIATDKTIFPRASLAFVATQVPDASGQGKMPLSRFMLDQDTGGAIRAPGRCDIYMGVGDQAGERAGHTYNEGKLYYVFAKDGITPAEPVEPVETPDPLAGTLEDDPYNAGQ